MVDVGMLVSILNLLGLGGLGIFIYYVIKGLRERVQALTDLAAEQHKTLDIVRTRAIELDQLRKDYRQALDDFQDIGHKLEERRNAVIRELELANKQKDEELARLKTLELEEIELKRKSLERVPELESRLASTVKELERQIRVVAEGSLASGSWRKARISSTAFDSFFDTLYSIGRSPVCHQHPWLSEGEDYYHWFLTSLLFNKVNTPVAVNPAVGARAAEAERKAEDITPAPVEPVDATPEDIAPPSTKKS